MSKGMKPLSDEEIGRVLSSFTGKFAARDKALFLLGIKSGFRISEILSITIGDVIQNGEFIDRLYVRRSSMKGKTEGRCVVLHPQAKNAIFEWLNVSGLISSVPETYLFKSRCGKNRSISRIQAWKILEAVFSRAGVIGVLGTHSLRKTFADRVYSKLGHDLVKTQKALGHKNINSTVSYLSFKDEQIDEAILSI